jgi:hypothetical protein
MAKLKLNIKQAAIKTAAIGAGAVGASMLNNVDFIGKMKPALRGGIKVALGVALPAFLAKGKKADFINGIGDGMVAIGVAELANSFSPNKPLISISGPGFNTIGQTQYVDEAYTAGVGFNNDTIGLTEDVPMYTTDADE